MKTNKVIARTGFTLVELAVVIVVIGVLASFAVPRFRASVERSKAAEAVNYLGSIQASQERYYARQGTYATNLTDLDIELTEPKYFTVPETFSAGSTGDLEDSWTLTLTRSGAAAGFGEYTVTFTESGFDAAASDVPANINPMGT